MNVRLILVLGAMTFLVGCATTQAPTAMNQMEIKVSQLEQQLAQRDRQIQELRDQVDGLSDRVEKQNTAAVAVPVIAPPAPVVTKESDEKDNNTEIIRVDATAADVQKALKTAGYYDGPVDGKIGSKSKKAIEAFQKDRNLGSDGIVGKKTWAELQKVSEKKVSQKDDSEKKTSEN